MHGPPARLVLVEGAFVPGGNATGRWSREGSAAARGRESREGSATATVTVTAGRVDGHLQVVEEAVPVTLGARHAAGVVVDVRHLGFFSPVIFGQLVLAVESRSCCVMYLLNLVDRESRIGMLQVEPSWEDLEYKI